MTVHRMRSGHVFECDGCDETLDTGRQDFTEATEVRLREGWTAERVKTEWLHLCPDCGGDGKTVRVPYLRG